MSGRHDLEILVSGSQFSSQPVVKKYLLSIYYVLGFDCGLRRHSDLGLNPSSIPSQLCNLTNIS